MAATYQVAQIPAEASVPQAQPACSVPERHETALCSPDDTPFSMFK